MKTRLETVRDGHRVLPVEAGATVEYWSEEVGKRSLVSKTYSSPDGKRRCIVAKTGPVHYKPRGLDSDDPWEEIDLSNPDDLKALYRLKRLTDGIGYTWTCREDERESVTVKLLGFENLPEPELREGGVVYWTDVAPGLDIYMRPTPYRYGIFKVLKDEGAPRTFSFRVSYSKTPKIAVTKRGSSLAPRLALDIAEGIDDLAELRFDRCFMPARLAWDRDGNHIEVKTGIKGNELTEEVILPEGFAAWPITVDTDVSYQIDASANDGYAYGVTFDADSPEVRDSKSTYSSFGRLGVKAYARAMMRFTGVQVPQGTSVTSAILRFLSGYNDSISLSGVAIKAEAADDSAPFVDYDPGIWTRTRTMASVAWSPSSWTALTWYDSPDIKTVIQAVIDRAGWAQGNALTCFIDCVASYITSGAYRRPKTYDADPVGTLGAQLLITIPTPPPVEILVENAAGTSLAVLPPRGVGPLLNATVSGEVAVASLEAFEPIVITTVGAIVEPPAIAIQHSMPSPEVEASADCILSVHGPVKIALGALAASVDVARSTAVLPDSMPIGIRANEPIPLVSGTVVEYVYPGLLDVRMLGPEVITKVSIPVEPPAAHLQVQSEIPDVVAAVAVRVTPTIATMVIVAPAPIIEAIQRRTVEAPAAAMSLRWILPSSVTTGDSAMIVPPPAQIVFAGAAPTVKTTMQPFIRPPVFVLPQPTTLVAKPSDSRLRVFADDTRTKVVIR